MPRSTDRGLGSTTAEGWTHFSTLVAGIAVYGAIGFGLDRLFGTGPILLMIGLLAGCAGGIYLVWIRAKQNAAKGSGRHER